MKVILVSDPSATKAAASLAIPAGKHDYKSQFPQELTNGLAA